MTQVLRVVTPLTITNSVLSATDVTEADYSAWSSGTTYALGDRVISTTTHKIYESLQGSNTNHDPTNSANSAWWIEVSPTNRWKLFDTSNSTQTAKSTSMYYELLPAVACTSLAALNLTDATEIRIRVTDPTDGLVYDETSSLIAPITESSWWVYFFESIQYQNNLVDFGLPSYPSATIRVDISGNSGLAVGVLLIGSPIEIGIATEAGAGFGIQDYSRIETNDFGDTVLVQRLYAKRASISTKVATSKVNAMFAVLTELRATPALWVAYDVLDPLVIFGFYKQFDATVSYADYTDLNIEIQGMT